MMKASWLLEMEPAMVFLERATVEKRFPIKIPMMMRMHFELIRFLISRKSTFSCRKAVIKTFTNETLRKLLKRVIERE